MKRVLAVAVLVGGASLLAMSPVFAQDLNSLNPLGGLGLDLDPFHIFTPAPQPVAPAPAPEASAPRAYHHHRRLHHAVAHHAHHAGLHRAAHHVAAHHAAHKAHVAKS